MGNVAYQVDRQGRTDDDLAQSAPWAMGLAALATLALAARLLLGQVNHSFRFLDAATWLVGAAGAIAALAGLVWFVRLNARLFALGLPVPRPSIPGCLLAWGIPVVNCFVPTRDLLRWEAMLAGRQRLGSALLWLWVGFWVFSASPFLWRVSSFWESERSSVDPALPVSLLLALPAGVLWVLVVRRLTLLATR